MAATSLAAKVKKSLLNKRHITQQHQGKRAGKSSFLVLYWQHSTFFPIFAPMKWRHGIWVCLLLLAACNGPQREARRMVKRAERLADTLPDSTAQLIGRVLRMPVSFSERERMDMALLQAEALMGDHGQEVPPMMDDDFFDDHAFLTTSPELERAADYYARKKQYDKAAHAALYSGFVQQHYNEKEAAMQSFKDAERYGKLANDSLTVAQAQYRMEGMLYDEGRYKEALDLLKAAKKGFGDRSSAEPHGLLLYAYWRKRQRNVVSRPRS